MRAELDESERVQREQQAAMLVMQDEVRVTEEGAREREALVEAAAEA